MWPYPRTADGAVFDGTPLVLLLPNGHLSQIRQEAVRNASKSIATGVTDEFRGERMAEETAPDSSATATSLLTRIDRFVQDDDVKRGFTTTALVLAFLIFVGFLYPAPAAILFLGAVLGSLSALTAMGLVLIYRANRVINFAQGDLGALAGVLSVSLIGGPGWGFFPSVLVGVVAALLMGAFIEVTFVRRFAKAPRLILTVATIGIAQLLAAGQLGIPVLFGFSLAPQDFPTPLDFSFSWDPVVFRGSHVFAIIVVPIVAAALAAFFRFTRIGMAVRASAESADRALLLGIPVKRIGTLVWILAAGLSGTAALLRAPIVGVSIGTVLGPGLLLRALAAAVIGRMENLNRTFAAAVVLGMVEQAVIWHTGRTLVADAVLFFVIIGALLLQFRTTVSRAVEKGQSSWQSISEVRPIPAQLRHLPEIRWGFGSVKAVVGVALLVLPLQLGARSVNLLSYGVILSILAMSLLILTGWSGQISLGQWAFAGFGAAFAGTAAQNGWNFFLTLVVAGLAGVVVAVLIGLPALRIRGPFLAVATFALALAGSSFFLNGEFAAFDWYVPDPAERILRPTLFGKFDLESEWTYYYVSLAILAVVLISIRSLRASRTGRVLVAARDNERAAQGYGVNLIRARLTGFALSGFYAALAGGLFAYHQHAMLGSPLQPAESITLFSIVVFGGLGSTTGVLIGVAWFQFLTYFVGSPEVRLLTTGFGLLLVLLFFPGGLGQVVYGTRDKILRRVAVKRGIVVPSLLADVRVDDDLPDPPDDPSSAEPTAIEVIEVEAERDDTKILAEVRS